VASFPGAFYNTASWRFLEVWFSKMVCRTFHRGQLHRELRLPPFTAWPPICFRSAGFIPQQGSRCDSGRCCVPSGVKVEPIQTSANAAVRQTNIGISGAMIEIDRVPVRSNGETAAKYDILEIPYPVSLTRKWRTRCPSLAARNPAPMGTETIS
jgi:hypothetical protein